MSIERHLIAQLRAKLVSRQRRALGAFRIVVIYVVVSGAWILFSDELVVWLIADPATQTTVNTLKGWGFVVTTALLLYELIRRHTAELQQRNEELARLYRASGALISNSTHNLGVLAHNVVQIVQQEFGQANCSVFLHQPNSAVIERLAVAGPYTETVREKNFTIDSPGLVPQALHTGQVINAPDVRAIPHYVPNWPAARSELTIPLLIGERVIGAIDIQSAQPAAFSGDDERLMSIFAERTALAMAQTQAEQALRESEGKFRSFVEQSFEGMALLDEQGHIIVWNRALEHITGMPRDQAIGSRFEDIQFQLLPSELRTKRSAEGFRTTLQHAFRTGQLPDLSQTAEIVIQAATGERKSLLQSIFPIKTEQGFRIGAIMRDITARKQAEEILRESEQRYRLMFESNPQPMWVYDLDTLQFLAVNEAASKQYGYTQDEFLAMTIKDIRPVEDVPALLVDVAQTSAPLNRAGVWRHLRKDGTLIAVEITSHLITFAGRAARLVLANDVTERQQAEEALHMERYRLRTLIDNLPDPIFLKDLQGRFVIANLATAEFIGSASPEELIGRTDFDYYPPNIAAQYHALEQQIMQSGEKLAGWERPQSDLKGNQHWLSGTKLPLRDGQGRIVGLVGIERIITERKLAEEEILQLNQDLERRVVERTAQVEAANQELESFAYSVSHDLRAPLRAINGFSRILQRDAAAELSAENQRYLELIHKNAVQMGDLIDALLTFSRSGRKPLTKQGVDMNQLARQTVELLRAGQEDRPLEIRPGELCPCQGDAELLKQVWTNLLSNAFKYTRDAVPAIVEIGCREQNDECVYYVKDNGVGFDMQYAHKLFGVFQRLHRPEDYEGTGVGLALVQRIITRHGGRVWAEAAVNQGATFFFTLGK